jgi:hypothetical protein
MPGHPSQKAALGELLAAEAGAAIERSPDDLSEVATAVKTDQPQP